MNTLKGILGISHVIGIPVATPYLSSIGHYGPYMRPHYGQHLAKGALGPSHVSDDVRHGLQGNNINGIIMFMTCYVLSCFMPTRVYAVYVLCIYSCCTST